MGDHSYGTSSFLVLDSIQMSNWRYEELRAWLDWDEKKQEEADQEAEAELITAGGFGRVRKDQGLRGGMSRIMGGVAAENRMYRFIN